MLHLILTNTALELIPKSIFQTPSVQKNLKKFGNAGKILDTSLHHSIMHNLKNSQQRGRPDILHHFLLDTLGSPANLFGHLKIYFHSSSGFFYVNSEMRCPRDYIRFKALMNQLLEVDNIPPYKQPYLISKIHITLKEWVKKSFLKENTFKFSKQGKILPLSSISSKIVHNSNDCLVIIGGFQKGNFSSEILTIPGCSIAIPNRGYDSWIIVNRLLAFYEKDLHLLD